MTLAGRFASFLSVFMPGFTPVNGQAAFGWRSGFLAIYYRRVAAYCRTELASCQPLGIGQNREGVLLIFSEVPNERLGGQKLVSVVERF